MSQKILNPLFALLIFTAHLNCVVEHQLICNFAPGDSITILDSSGVPVNGQDSQNSDECEHGCICKGATLAPSFVLENLQFQWVSLQFLATQNLADAFENAQRSASDSANTPVRVLPLRAQDRCALMQTFLI